ncbi:MAG: MFS transporter [Gemmatimonadetes bacterium]|nr:MFS transporter [Gemmatimonadota bacterium]MBI3504518.1 MFS transporter [Pseudomonadota bacterium]
MPEAAQSPYAVLRIPNYRWYIAGLLAFTMAIQIQGTVVGWQIYELTHDKLALGLIGLAEALPFISMSLYAGHVVDRHDRRRVALFSLAVLLGCAIALLVLPAMLPQAPRMVVHAIYAVIVASGLARSFLQPARQALGAELVPRELYGNAITWRSGAWQLAAVIGPALGGILYAAGGTRLAYATDVGLTVVGVAAFAAVRHRSAPQERHDERIMDSLAVGVRFVFGERLLLAALSLDLFSVLFGGATALLPVFAAEILHVGPRGLGLLRAAPAIGAVAMSVAIAHLPPVGKAGRALLRAVALFGICIIIFGFSTNLALSVAALAVSGAADMISVFIRSTLIQTMTPVHMLGRVMSVNSVFVGSSNEIGMFESGVTAQWFGTVPSVVLGGIATLVVVGVTAWRVPALRALGRIDSHAVN